MKCDNCGHPLVDHCRVHLIPCCPGKCRSEAKRRWTVACSATYSCGWKGFRFAVSHRLAQAAPCPNCGEHVRASGAHAPAVSTLKDPGPAASSRYYLL